MSITEGESVRGVEFFAEQSRALHEVAVVGAHTVQTLNLRGPPVPSHGETTSDQGLKERPVTTESKGGKKRKLYPHGNYHNYYGYRALGSFDEDPRLRLLQAGWFRGRHVLDVGCNEGLVTLGVSAGFGCSRTTGVDIDGTLIKRAQR